MPPTTRQTNTPGTIPSEGGLRGRRVRRWLADHQRLVLTVALLLVLAGATATYTTSVAPGTDRIETATPTYTSTLASSHQATVQTASTLYPAGATLTDHLVYYTTITPRLDGATTFTYTSPHETPVTVTMQTQLVVRSVDRTGDTVYWQTTRPLSAPVTRRLAPGARLQVPYTIDVPAQQAEIARIRDELGATLGQAELLVQTETTVTGTVDGQPVASTDQHEVRIALAETTYRVQAPADTVTAPTRPDVRVVQRTYPPLQRAGAGLLLGGGLVATGCLGIARWRGWLTLPTAIRETLDYDVDRRTFDAWITQGTLPATVETPPTIEVASLAGLVDLAIDTENRIIEDTTTGRLHVLTDAAHYQYTPPAAAHDSP